jgi:hypothetical protein
LIVQPGAGAESSWFTVASDDGQPPAPPGWATGERGLPVAGTATVDVTVRIPETAPAGAVSFALGAALEESPDRVVSSPTVAFPVPAPTAKRKFPWWIVIVAAVALLVLVGGGILIYFLTRPDDTAPPASSPSPTHEVAQTGELQGGGFDHVDLDTKEVSSGFVEPPPGADVVFRPSFADDGGPLNLVAGENGARVSLTDDPTFEGCEAAPDYDDDEAQLIRLPDVGTTFVCVRFTDDGRMALLTIGSLNEETLRAPVSFVTWKRAE